MNCSRCGNKLKQGEVFCGKCGLQIQIGDHPGNAQKPEAIAPRSSTTLRTAGIISALIVLAAVAAFIFIVPRVAVPSGRTAEDSSSFSTKMLPGFIFNETQTIEIAEEPVHSPAVTGIAPASGTTGTKIQISGNALSDAGLMSVMIGETELSIYSVNHQLIEAIVPFGAGTGKVSLIYDGQSVDAGVFEVLPQQRQLLTQQIVSSSADAQTVSSDTISLTIPGGALTQVQTVKIESIADPQPINLPQRATICFLEKPARSMA